MSVGRPAEAEAHSAAMQDLTRMLEQRAAGQEPDFDELTIESTRGILPRGGTILGTRNRGRFVARQEGEKSAVNEAAIQEALACWWRCPYW